MIKKMCGRSTVIAAHTSWRTVERHSSVTFTSAPKATENVRGREEKKNEQRERRRTETVRKKKKKDTSTGTHTTTRTHSYKKKLGHQLIRHNVITPIKARRNPSSPSHFNMISVIAYLTSLQG